LNESIQLNLNHLGQTEFSASWLCSPNKELYLSGTGTLQYSNLAFFSELTDTNNSMLTFIFLGLIGLFLYFCMLIEFGRRILKFSKKSATIFALASVFSHLYFTTILNGHIGTLMIAGPLVYLLNRSFMLAKAEEKLSLEIISGIIFSTAFIFFAYPFITPFLFSIILIGILAIHTNLSRLYWLVSTAYFAAISIFLWAYFIPQREKVLDSFRSWGSFLTPISVFQYTGLFPGNVMGSQYLNFIQNTSQKYGISSSLNFLALALPILGYITMLIFYSIRRGMISRPLIISIVQTTVGLSLIVALTSKDSYFFYKISYIFQFMIIGVCFAGFLEIQKELNSSGRRKLSNFHFLLIALIASLNIGWSTFSTIEMLQRNTVWGHFSDEIQKFDKSQINNSISMIEEGGDDYVVNYILSTKRSKYTLNSNLKYGLYADGKAAGQTLQMRSLLPDTFRINPNGISGTEKEQGNYFRWVAGGKFTGVESRGISIERLHGSSRAIHMGFCASLADWVPKSRVLLRAVDDKSNLLGAFDISKQRKCFDFALGRESNLFYLQTNEIGSFPSLFDRRKILYRLWVSENGYFYKIK